MGLPDGAVEKVARALYARTHLPKPWDQIGPTGQQHYLNLARAAIDALELTEESKTIPVVAGRIEHTQPCLLPDHIMASEGMHTCGYSKGHFEFHPSTRLVSPWTRTEGGKDE